MFAMKPRFLILLLLSTLTACQNWGGKTTSATPAVLPIGTAAISPTLTPQPTFTAAPSKDPIAPRLVEQQPRPGLLQELPQAFTLVFDMPMDPATVRGAVAVEPPLAFEVAVDGPTVRLFPIEPLVPGQTIHFTLGAGAAAAGGGPTLTAPISWSASLPPLLIELGKPGSTATDRPVEITFNYPIARKSLEILSINPKTPGQFRLKSDGQTVRFTPQFPWIAGLSYRILFSGDLHLANGAVIPKPEPVALGAPSPDSPRSQADTNRSSGPDIDFGLGEWVQLIDVKGPRAIQYSSFAEQVGVPVTFTLYRLSWAEFIEAYVRYFEEISHFDNLETDLVPDPTTLVQNWTTLTNPGRPDDPWVQETVLPEEVSAGLYLLDLSTGGIRRDQLLLVLTDQVLLARKSNRQLFTWLAEIHGGAQADVPVEIYGRDGRLLERGRTDAAGVYLTGTDFGPAGPLLIAAGDGDNRTICGLTWLWGSLGLFRAFEQAFVPESIYLFTDRPLYRPGQPVRFRAVIRRFQSGQVVNPPPGSPVVVQLVNQQGHFLQTADLATNDFGIVHGFLALDPALAPGSYALEVRTGQATNHVWFPVVNDPPPPVDIFVSLEKEQPVFGETLSVTVRALTPDGEPIARATVTGELFSSFTPFSRASRAPAWVWDDPDIDGSIQGTTGTDGTVTLTFPLPPGNPDSGIIPGGLNLEQLTSARIKNMLLAISVAGSSAQESRSFHTIPTATAAERVAQRPVPRLVELNRPNQLTLEVTDLNGQPVSSREITATIFAERPSEGQSQPIIREEKLVTGADGRVVYNLVLAEPGWYRLRFEGRDAKGRPFFLQHRIPAGFDQVPLTTGSGLRVLTEKQAYQPGETARLFVRSLDSGAALMTVEQDGVSRFSIVDLNAPFTTIDLPVSTADGPNALVTIYFWQPQTDELWSRSSPETILQSDQTNLYLPQGGKSLTVEIVPDRARFTAAAEASFIVRVTNEKGQPVSAEVALALVDEPSFGLVASDENGLFRTFHGFRSPSGHTYDGFSPIRYFGSAPHGHDFGGDESGSTAFQFPDTAFWAPELRTDARGEVRVTLQLPSHRTGWRLTAQAITADTQVGEAIFHFVID